MAKLSIIVPMGFVNQTCLEEGCKANTSEILFMQSLAKAKKDFELIIVDRNWPHRWKDVEHFLYKFIDKVMYIPPRPSVLIGYGFRVCGGMKNNGAIVSTGDVIAFTDDFTDIDGEVADKMVDYYEQTGNVLCPVTGYVPGHTPQDDNEQIFSGHNYGVHNATREQFILLNGYDENYDGSYGESDTDFEYRLDVLMTKMGRGTNQRLRRRRKDIFWKCINHRNGQCPQTRKKIWPKMPDSVLSIGDKSSAIRCNRCYFEVVSKPRADKGFVFCAPPTKEEIEELRKHICIFECIKDAKRNVDRKDQIDSYHGVLKANHDTAILMQTWYHNHKLQTGCFNPWR